MSTRSSKVRGGCAQFLRINFISESPVSRRNALANLTRLCVAMTALNVHLNELLTILLASEGLRPQDMTPVQIRDAIAMRLIGMNLELSNRLFHFDDWQTDALGEFVTDAHALAQSWETAQTLAGGGKEETRVE